jgi:hypothetical protein
MKIIVTRYDGTTFELAATDDVKALTSEERQEIFDAVVRVASLLADTGSRQPHGVYIRSITIAL